LYRAITRRLALASYSVRPYWAALHLGERKLDSAGKEQTWLGYPSLASVQVHLNDWALPIRIHSSHSYGSRPGGYAFKNGKTVALVHVTLSIDVLCFSLSVLVYRHPDKSVL
jgi:hypothetical protein